METFDTSKKYYVYCWFIKDTREVFYVGKGKNNRYKTRKRENKAFMNVIKNNDCDVQILQDNLSEKEAFDLEVKMISFYRTHSNILTNVCDGGPNPPSLSGIPKSDEWKRKRSKSQIDFYQNHPEYKEAQSNRFKEFLKTEQGKQFQEKSIASRKTAEFKRKLSIQCKLANNTKEYKERHSKLMREIYSSEVLRERERGKNNPRAQGVKQFDERGNFIREYDTITQASRETGVHISRISDVARGNRKTAGGFVWVFSNDKKIVHKRRPVYNPEKDKNLKPILQYDLNGNFIKEYIGIADATRLNGFKNRTNIICNLKGRTKSAYGFIWKYK